MTIDELIELATEAREDLGGDAQVRIAYQPGYPLRAALGFVTIPYSTDPDELYGHDEQAAGQQHDGTFLWLAAGDLPDRENPHAPGWAWLDHDTGHQVVRVVHEPGETTFLYCLDPHQGCLYEARFSPGTPDAVISAAIGAALRPPRPGPAGARPATGRRRTRGEAVNRDDDR